MTPFIHKATLYTQTGDLDIYGRPIWNTPVIVKCRWEDVSSTYVDGVGLHQRSKSRVYIDRPAQVGDYIVKGEFPDSSPYPSPEINAKEIKDFRMISNVSGDRTEYRVLL